MQTDSHPHIRWLIRRDELEVLDIDRESFAVPWTEDDLIRSLRSQNTIGMVAEATENGCKATAYVQGFMVYELYGKCLVLCRMAVHPRHRRQGVGTQMIAKLRSKLNWRRRTKIMVHPRETNLAAHLFLRACGFRADGTEAGDTGPSTIRFSFRLPDDGGMVIERILGGDVTPINFRVPRHVRHVT